MEARDRQVGAEQNIQKLTHVSTRVTMPPMNYGSMNLIIRDFPAQQFDKIKSCVITVSPSSSPIHLRRCVTLARATENACKAENGYWKSRV